MGGKLPIFRQAGGIGLYRLLIPIRAFPDLLQAHRADDPDTSAIEAEAIALATGGFAPGAATAFVRRVCAWGGYHGIGGRVLGRNSPEVIAATLQNAYRLCGDGEPVEGLGCLTRLSGLGVSFASKHLKFLAPERAVVLDSVISTKLGYSLDSVGYREFLADCHALLDAVRAAEIPFPFEGEGSWRLSDVEMVLFQHLRTVARRGQ